jgi:hypothetical protein
MNFAALPPEASAAIDAIYQLLAILADRAKTKAALARSSPRAMRHRPSPRSSAVSRSSAPPCKSSKPNSKPDRCRAGEDPRSGSSDRCQPGQSSMSNARCTATKVEALRADREQLERSRSAHESKPAELVRTHRALA